MRAILSVRDRLRTRLMLTICAFACGSMVMASPAVQTSACEKLDAQGREAMQWFISGAFPIPSPWIECREDNGVNAAMLRRQRSASVPCLLQIYRSGLANTGLWLRSEPAPMDGEWTVNILGQVDPPSAIVLWREKASSARDPWTRLWQLFQAGRLGDPTVLPDLTRGLADPPSSPGWKPYERYGFLAEIADLLAQYDYRPALSVLRQLNDPPRPAFEWVGLHILQLQGDVGALERRTWDKESAGGNAVRALYRMHARDALARIAADPKHPLRSTARHYLSLDIRL